MVRGRVLFGIAVALAIATPLRVAAEPPDRPDRPDRIEEIDRAAKRVLTDRYQRMDDEATPAARERARRRNARRRFDDDRGGGASMRRGGPGEGLGAVFQLLVWGAIAVAAVLLLVAIANELVRRRAEPPAPETPVREEDVVPKAALERPLDDAERLAHEGRFAEAIHVLLLRTFQDLTRAAGVTIAPSWTSREVLGKIWLTPEAREALVDLVHVVELTWFGDDVPGEADWQRCRAQFDRFVTAYRAPAAARAAA